MARLDVDVEVNGKEKIDDLGESIDDVTQKAKMSKKALAGWTAGITSVVYAIKEVISAGHDYLTNLEDINNTIVTTTELEDNLSTSFGMASASILEQTGLWDAYRETLVMVGNALDAVAGKEAILRQARQEHLAMEKEYQEMLKENEKEEEKIAKAKIQRMIKEMEVQERAYNKKLAQDEKLRQKNKELVDAHQEELKVLAELLNIYEEQGRNTDDLITKIEKLEQVDVLHVKTIREKAEELAKATSEIKENTDAVEENTGAVEENTGAIQENAGSQGGLMSAREQNGRSVDPSKTFRGSGRVISGAEAYANYYMGTPKRANDYSEEMLRELKKLNNKVSR